MAALYPLIRVSSPFVLLSIILIFSKPYDFTGDLVESSLEAFDTIPYESNTATTPIQDNNAKNFRKANNWRKVKAFIKRHIKKVDPLILIGIAVIFVLGVVGIKFFLKMRKPGPPKGEGFTDEVLSIPEDESIEDCFKEVNRLVLKLYSVVPLAGSSVEDERERCRVENEHWKARITEDAKELAEKISEAQIAQLSPEERETRLQKRLQYVEKFITPNLEHRDTTELEFAVANVRNVLFEITHVSQKYCTDLIKLTLSMHATEKQDDWDPKVYKDSFDWIREIPIESRTDLQKATLVAFDFMIPRLVRINNHLATYTGAINKALQALQEEDLPADALN